MCAVAREPSGRDFEFNFATFGGALLSFQPLQALASVCGPCHDCLTILFIVFSINLGNLLRVKMSYHQVFGVDFRIIFKKQRNAKEQKNKKG